MWSQKKRIRRLEKLNTDIGHGLVSIAYIYLLSETFFKKFRYLRRV